MDADECESADKSIDFPRYNFPKVELHCHLEGCYRASTVVELAKQYEIPLPVYDKEKIKQYIALSSPSTSLGEYLEVYYRCAKTFAGNADALTRIAYEAVQDRAKDGVAYVEIRYAPLLLANCDVESIGQNDKRGRMRPKDVIEIISKAFTEAAVEFDIQVKTILCDLCGHKGWSQKTAELCAEYKHLGVVGFDVSGSKEFEKYGRDQIQAFQYCKMNGIHRTVHAGESGPAKVVEMAMEELSVDRIGHGYHAVEDDKVYDMLKKSGIHLEVCPASSYFTNAVPKDCKWHPAQSFLEDGVNFSLNSDAPSTQQTTIIDDYDIATEKWGFSTDDLKQLNLNAARSSFMDYSEREQLIQELKEFYGRAAVPNGVTL